MVQGDVLHVLEPDFVVIFHVVISPELSRPKRNDVLLIRFTVHSIISTERSPLVSFKFVLLILYAVWDEGRNKAIPFAPYILY